MTTKTYEVTELAGPRVAGRMIAGQFDARGGFTAKRGQKFELTEAEAEFELAFGTIKEVKAPPPLAAEDAKTKK